MKVRALRPLHRLGELVARGSVFETDSREGKWLVSKDAVVEVSEATPVVQVKPATRSSTRCAGCGWK